MRKVATLICSMLSIMLLVSACSNGSTSSEKSGSKKYVAMIAKGFSQSYWVSVNQGAKDAAKKYNVELSFTGPDNDSQVDKQATMVQNAVDKSPDAIAIAPLDEAALTPAIANAKSANIPLFAFDTAFTKKGITKSAVYTDNYKAGALAAENFVRLTGGHGSYAIIAHSQTDATSTERRDGFIDYMKKNAPEMVMAGTVQYCQADQAISENLTNSVLQANPGLSGIFTTNEASATGAASSVEAAQKAGKKIVLVGFDSGAAQQQYIRDGVVAGSVSQNPYQIGYKTIENVAKYLKGESVGGDIDSGSIWYDSSNINDPKVKEALYQ